MFTTKPKSHSNLTQANDLDQRRNDLRDLIERVLKDLVDFPEDIGVTYTAGERTTCYNITCTRRVIGQILGAQGRNIQGLRAITNAISARSGFRSIIEVPYYKPGSDE